MTIQRKSSVNAINGHKFLYIYFSWQIRHAREPTNIKESRIFHYKAEPRNKICYWIPACQMYSQAPAKNYQQSSEAPADHEFEHKVSTTASMNHSFQWIVHPSHADSSYNYHSECQAEPTSNNSAA